MMNNIELIDIVESKFDEIIKEVSTIKGVKEHSLEVKGLKNVFVLDCLENDLGLSSSFLSTCGKENEEILIQYIESGNYNLGYVIRRWIDCQLHLDSEGSKVTSKNFYETVDNFMTQYDKNHSDQLELFSGGQ